MIPTNINRAPKQTKTIYPTRASYDYTTIISLWNDVASHLQVNVEDQLAESLVWKFNARHLEIKQDIYENIWFRLQNKLLEEA